LLFHPAGSVRVADGVDLVENDQGGVVALWGMLTWCWEPTDVVARRLAVVQLVATGAAGVGQVAAGFEMSPETVRQWSRAFEAAGVAGLGLGVKGPKQPSKLTVEKKAEITAIRAAGVSMAEVAARLGVSLNSVSRALRADDPLRPAAQRPTPGGEAGVSQGELVALARPELREQDRQAARAGLLEAADPLFCDGAGLALAGALVILSALVAACLFDAFSKVYGATRRACFYGLFSLISTMVFSALVGEARAEGLTRVDPVALGRLLGLDRAPRSARCGPGWPPWPISAAARTWWPRWRPPMSRPTRTCRVSSISTGTSAPITAGPGSPRRTWHGHASPCPEPQIPG